MDLSFSATPAVIASLVCGPSNWDKIRGERATAVLKSREKLSEMLAFCHTCFDAIKARASVQECDPYRDRILSIWARSGLFRAMPEQAMKLLQEACDNGDELLGIILFQNMDAFSRDAQNNTPLHIVCRSGTENLVRHALREVYKQTSSPWNRAKQLLGAFRSPLLERNNLGVFPLQLGYGNQKVQDFGSLIGEVGFRRHMSVNEKGETRLHTAVVYSRMKGLMYSARELLSEGSHIEARDNEGTTPFALACLLSRFEAAQWLLDHNADIETRGKSGTTPFATACLMGNSDVAQWLLDHNADIDTREDRGYTPFALALLMDKLDSAAWLVNRGADIDVRLIENHTSLSMVCRDGNREAVQFLLDRNANVNVFTNQGNTPLHLACREGHREIVELLLSRNANVHVRNANGQTPLSEAIANNQLEVVELLQSRLSQQNLPQGLASAAAAA